jgi:two-component system NtrC family sensor kinase
VTVTRRTAKVRSLRNRLFISFILIIIVIGLANCGLIFYLVQHDIISRSQEQAGTYLETVDQFFRDELEKLHTVFSLLKPPLNRERLKKKLGLDYVMLVDGNNASGSPFAAAAGDGVPAGGFRLMPRDELAALGEDLLSKARIEIFDTPKSGPSNQKVLESALVLEYAYPLTDERLRVTGVLYGGKILNRDFPLIDQLHKLVFDNKLYNGKPLGTITVFLRDVRITTNVLNDKGQRAVGTRVSEAVYNSVFIRGETWIDRAFVVTDWYRTAYKPIRDGNGTIIGILYVGILEKPFTDMTFRLFALALAIFTGVIGLGMLLTFLLSRMIFKPLKAMLGATARIALGDYDHTFKLHSSIKELDIFNAAFKRMARELHKREQRLKLSGEKLVSLNKSYLDLIGFVSHELKGILSSTILNAYTVRDGFLGMVNFKQRKALDSITRNLDYLAETVKNFLSLSRIEKGELMVDRARCLLREDIFDPVIETYEKPAAEKGMRFVNRIDPGLILSSDRDLLFIVVNNLIGNAVKYGRENGTIIVAANRTRDSVTAEVFNEGEPLAAEETGRLFGKFVRLESAKKRHIKGTGLGLFITREIVEKHGGKIWCESRQNGNAFIFTIERGEYAHSA